MHARMRRPPAHRKQRDERGTARLNTHEQFFTVVDRATCHGDWPFREKQPRVLPRCALQGDGGRRDRGAVIQAADGSCSLRLGFASRPRRSLFPLVFARELVQSGMQRVYRQVAGVG
jgi:hypothetical protein